MVKMKTQKEDCLPQILRFALVNGKIYMNVTNTGQGEVHLHRGQNIGIGDLILSYHYGWHIKMYS